MKACLVLQQNIEAMHENTTHSNSGNFHQHLQEMENAVWLPARPPRNTFQSWDCPLPKPTHAARVAFAAVCGTHVLNVLSSQFWNLVLTELPCSRSVRVVFYPKRLKRCLNMSLYVPVVKWYYCRHESNYMSGPGRKIPLSRPILVSPAGPDPFPYMVH